MEFKDSKMSNEEKTLGQINSDATLGPKGIVQEMNWGAGQLPSVEEIAECLCKCEGEPGLFWQDYTTEAQAILDLLKGKKS